MDAVYQKVLNRLIYSDKTLPAPTWEELRESREPDYRVYDALLDQLIAAIDAGHPEPAQVKIFHRLLQRPRNAAFQAVYAQKRQQFPAGEIAETLGMPVEEVYYAEFRILQIFRSAKYNLERQRADGLL